MCLMNYRRKTFLKKNVSFVENVDKIKKIFSIENVDKVKKTFLFFVNNVI